MSQLAARLPYLTVVPVSRPRSIPCALARSAHLAVARAAPLGDRSNPAPPSSHSSPRAVSAMATAPYGGPAVAPGRATLGFCGIGIMGLAMCRRERWSGGEECPKNGRKDDSFDDERA